MAEQTTLNREAEGSSPSACKTPEYRLRYWIARLSGALENIATADEISTLSGAVAIANSALSSFAESQGGKADFESIDERSNRSSVANQAGIDVGPDVPGGGANP